MAKLARAVDRMQKTIERQIDLATPSVAISNEASSIEVVKTGCSTFDFNTNADVEYLLSLADIADAEARSARENAKAWRDIAKRAADGADQAGQDGNEPSKAFQNAKAKELFQRALDYDAIAADKSQESENLRRQANEKNEEHCENKTTVATNPGSAPAVKTPAPATSAAPVTAPTTVDQSKAVCGPDITDNVFNVLDKIHMDWKSWSATKKGNKCRALFKPWTAGSAWDIKALAPGHGAKPQNEFSSKKAYERYIKWGKFWFEEDAAACSKPRNQCTKTATFLGTCIDPQVINYVQWGTMNKLCDQEGFARVAHAAYSFSQPERTFIGQKLMVDIGSSYTVATDAGSYLNIQSADPGEKDIVNNQVRMKLRSRLKEMMSEPNNALFGTRAANACSVPCHMTATEKSNLSKRDFGYLWED